MAVFADPNCGYCKRLEKDLQQLKDVTVYTFMVAILGDDSKVKLDNIWCVQDRTQAWRDWMLAGVQPSRTFGMCASPAQRNLALSQRLGIRGTPAIFFEDGTRIGGAAAASVIEQRLVKAAQTRNRSVLSAHLLRRALHLHVHGELLVTWSVCAFGIDAHR